MTAAVAMGGCGDCDGNGNGNGDGDGDGRDTGSRDGNDRITMIIPPRISFMVFAILFFPAVLQ